MTAGPVLPPAADVTLDAEAPVTLARTRHTRLLEWALGPCVVVLFVIVAIVGPWLSPYGPETIRLDHQFEPPSGAHWLGTADNGVDVLSTLLHGARLAGEVAALVVGISLVFGTLVGVWAGYRGRWADHLVTGVADVVQAFPAIVLHIAILAIVARPGLFHLVVALSSTGWVVYARIARAQTLMLREREFVIAARALGMPDRRVLIRHVVPNIAPALVVQATSGLGGAVLVEATLSFLGLGPGTNASWGALLDEGSAVLLRFPHVALLAGGAIAFTVLGFNLCGDWLRDRMAR